MTGGNDRIRAPEAHWSKAAWRSWARKRRFGADSQALGVSVSTQLESWSAYRQASNVLVYLAFGGEPDLSPLLKDAAKSFLVTRTGDSRDLSIHRLDPDALEPHRFGFLQPAAAAPTVDASLIDLALVPGLAFDRSGNRLGFGRGYYDRLLATLSNDAVLVGVTPAELLVPRLPAEPHDVRMTHLVTEQAILPIQP